MDRRWMYTGWILATLLAAPAALAVDCQLACVTGGTGTCELGSPAGAKVNIDGVFRNYANCQMLSVPQAEGPRFQLRYRHKARWFSPPGGVVPGPLGQVFDKYPPDACGVPSPACIQARMNGMVAAVGGHGIDGKESKPGGEGSPCTIALPCGVVLPPPEIWSFRLADAAISGTWTLRLARGTPPPGQPPEVSVYIKQGVARLPGSWLAPGAQYMYRFVDDAGRASSSGEFSVASRATHNTLKTLMQRRVAQGLPESLAWADTLAANDHDWDALQLSLAEPEPPR